MLRFSGTAPLLSNSNAQCTCQVLRQALRLRIDSPACSTAHVLEPTARTRLPPCNVAASPSVEGKAAFASKNRKKASQSQAQSNTKCPCGSRKLYHECCKTFHDGAWAHTAAEVAMARISATLLGLPEFLVNSTHPESLDLIGGSRQLTREVRQKIKQHQRLHVQVQDMCQGEGGPLSTAMGRVLQQGGRTQDSWLVAMALRYTLPDGTAGKDCPLERYVKHQGQWMYLCRDYEPPSTGAFDEFAERHWVNEPTEAASGGGLGESESMFSDTWQAKAGVRSDGSAWSHTFDLVQPSYAPGGTTEDEMLGPWLWDELAVHDGELAPLQPGQSRPRRRDLVYLDDYAPKSAVGQESRGFGGFGRQQQLFNVSDDEGEELSVRRAAVLNDRLRQQMSMMRNPDFDLETWMFRTGRFRYNDNHN